MGGIGGVLLDRRDMSYQFFRWRLPQKLCEALAARAGGNPIHQLEALPLLIACRLWADRLKNTCGLAFVDNEGARAALVAGRSSHAVSNHIVSEVGDLTSEAGTILV